MAIKKSQHYVPQFYLRGFSLAECDRLIALYNIPSGLYVPKAAIRNQACSNNFYKSLMIEDSLAAVEGAASGVIRGILENKKVPEFHSPEHYCLLLFCLFQAFRTPWKAEEIDELTDKMTKQLAANEPTLREHLDEFTVHQDNPAAMALDIIAHSHHIAFDLRFKILVNETKIPFITSDGPAILYNQFLERRKKFGSNTGIALKGLQVFLPLSPSRCLLFFDEAVYRVGGGRATHILERVCEHDAWQLSLLQAAGAYQNIYFDDHCSEELARKMVQEALKWRRQSKAHVNPYKPVGHTGVPEVLLHSYGTDIRMGLNLKVIKELPSVRGFQLGTQIVHRRDPFLCKIHEAFLKEVDEGKYKLSQFTDFIRANWLDEYPL